MTTTERISTPQLDGLGLAAGGESIEVRQIRSDAARFAEKVMRPIGIFVDRLSAADAAAADSPLYGYLDEVKKVGFLDVASLASLKPEEQQAILPALNEELGSGDVGLALLGFVAGFTSLTALGTGDPELIDQFADSRGCWIGSQPDRGSDVLDPEGMLTHLNGRVATGNLTAKKEGSDFVITGQSSAWISVSPIANAGVLHIPCDFGDGFYASDGSLNQAAFLVSFDERGVSKGKPLEKLGQRPLPQGEVFFDSVRLPTRNMVADRGHASVTLHTTVLLANLQMGMLFTGVARAAFQLALEYVHERRQGGAPLIEHQLIRARIFAMWLKLEAARALTSRVAAYHHGDLGPHGLAGLTGKISATQAAFDIARESVMLFGANGLAREYPIEKICRDAQTALIQDGENNLLGLLGGTWISRSYREK